MKFHRSFNRWLTGLLVSVSALSASGAAVAEADISNDLLFAAALGGAASSAAPMSEAELDEARGGARGLYFGFAFSADYATASGAQAGQLPPNVDVTAISESQVQVVGAFGSLSGNFNGVLQTTNVVGNMNVVNNNLVINVFMLPPSVTDISGIIG